MGESFSVRHAAVIAVNLPAKSRVRIAMDKGNAWDTQEYLLAEVVDLLALSLWVQSRGKKSDRPKSIKRPENPVPKENEVMTSEDYQEKLSRPRKEVSRGN